MSFTIVMKFFQEQRKYHENKRQMNNINNGFESQMSQCVEKLQFSGKHIQLNCLLCPVVWITKELRLKIERSKFSLCSVEVSTVEKQFVVVTCGYI